jgi:uroporphyrinogen-III synthase
MRPLLIIRPEPGNTATVTRAKARGLLAVGIPLFEIETTDWSADEPDHYVGVLLTSANAVHRAGHLSARYHHLPAFAVGGNTADAARGAGFASVVSGEGDVSRLIAQIATLGLHRLLHLSGEDVTPFDALGIDIDRRIVYRARPRDPGPTFSDAIDTPPVILVHSPRAAQRLNELVPTARKPGCVIVAISQAVYDAAGNGWEKVAVAREPRDEAMLDKAASLCGQ